MPTKYILVGGYPHKAPDGGKGFAEELVKGFDEPVKILDCLFARPRENWEKAFAQDQEFFAKQLPGKQLEFAMALPEQFREQVRLANVIYIRGGVSEALFLQLQKPSEGWQHELSGKTLAGSSAGADVISKYYYGLDDLQIAEGLGLLPVKVIPHYGSDYNAPHIDWTKAEAELAAYKEPLPLIKLAEGQFEVRVR
ncbi:MAG: Type 1 glutamine amidotransferase-like domain-containing protein [Parcubacteria group bacterium]|nr:Type 1 glutamine amidotransferase-like domain-containing protein [Parcubacteria group bacterium]